MELLNTTGMTAGYTMGMLADGREMLVVVVKGTFAIPRYGSEPVLLDKQLPLIEADVYYGDPGISAVQYESDYAPRKPRCDVLLNGSAHAPGGRPATVVPVSLNVGPMKKSFNVTGTRIWLSDLGTIKSSPPRQFVEMPISYGNAFGGTDASSQDPAQHRAYMDNPVGVGFHSNLQIKSVEGKPLPNTEEPGVTVTKPGGAYRPMAFGCVGRNFQQRINLAGTYDQQWQDQVFPFLPADFNEGYFQSAPQDQQLPFLRGGERVDLVNLTTQGRTTFNLPTIEVPVVFFRKKGDRVEIQAVADTLILEPDNDRFMITWRASLLLKKNMFEIPQVLAGSQTRAWWRARELGKTYYRSLGELCRTKLQESSEEAE